MLGLRTTIYKVPDLEIAKKWYTQAFKQDPYFDEAFYVGFNIGGFELGLQPSQNSAYKNSDNVICYWGVEDIKKEFERLIELGGLVHEQPTNVGGELMVASLFDPWGNVIGLIYNPDFTLKHH